MLPMTYTYYGYKVTRPDLIQAIAYGRFGIHGPWPEPDDFRCEYCATIHMMTDCPNWGAPMRESF